MIEYHLRLLLLGLGLALELVRWIQDAVIATDNFIDRAQENRILGARRIMTQASFARGPALSHGTVLFTVVCEPPAIVAGEILRIFNISDTPATRPQNVTFYLPNVLSS
jgi:type VI secretion system protein ImpJ